LLAGAVVVVAPAPAGAAQDPPGPPLQTSEATLAAAYKCPGGFHHPEHHPVLLVHGTSVTVDENWGWTYLPALTKAGYDVCTIQMPDYAFVDVQVSVEYVVYAIRETARRAHARITTIGLSQGGIEPRWALKWWPDIHDHVSSYIGMATPNHGSFYGNGCVANVTTCVPAVWQQAIGSNFLTALNRDTETPYKGSVAYTTVYSLTDDIIQPAVPSPTGALAGAVNIAVQDICPGRYVGHIQSAWDAAYYAVVIDALSHGGAADPARVDRAYCNQQGMPGVDTPTGLQQTATLYAVAGERQSLYVGRTTSEAPLRCYATPQGCPAPPTSAAGSRRLGQVLPNTGAGGPNWPTVPAALLALGLVFKRRWTMT
jgi:hypothetical protein